MGGRVEEGEVQEGVGGGVAALEEERVEGAELEREGRGVEDADAEEADGEGGKRWGGRGGEEAAGDGVHPVGADEEGAGAGRVV